MTEVQMNDAAEWLARLPEPITWHLRRIADEVIGMDHEEKQDAARLICDVSVALGATHRGPEVCSVVALLVTLRRLITEVDTLASPIAGG